MTLVLRVKGGLEEVLDGVGATGLSTPAKPLPFKCSPELASRVLADGSGRFEPHDDEAKAILAAIQAARAAAAQEAAAKQAAAEAAANTAEPSNTQSGEAA